MSAIAHMNKMYLVLLMCASTGDEKILVCGAAAFYLLLFLALLRAGFRSEELVSFLDVYKDSRYAPKRPVTDLRASPTFHELFLAAYGSPGLKLAALDDVEGCVLVWSLALKQRPEYVFTCQVRSGPGRGFPAFPYSVVRN